MSDFAAATIGAGLHVAAHDIEGQATIGATAVVGYETVGHRHAAEALEQMTSG